MTLPRIRPVPVVLLAALLPAAALPGPGRASAQLLRGSVVDGRTGRPVSFVHLRLLDTLRSPVAGAVSDEGGRFSLSAPAPGSYLVFVERLGYFPLVDGVFDLGPGGVMDLEVRLRPARAAADPVAADAAPVAAPVPYLETVGFYARRRVGLGYHFDARDVAGRSAPPLTSLIRGLPGVWIASGAGAPWITFGRSFRRCSPEVYVDGVPMATPLERAGHVLDELLLPEDVLGVEVYPGVAGAPRRPSGPDGCGLILVWTKPR